jgi:hypothetical protein
MMEETLVDMIEHVGRRKMAGGALVENALMNEVAVDYLGEVSVACLRVGFKARENAVDACKAAARVPRQPCVSCAMLKGPVCHIAESGDHEDCQGKVVGLFKEGIVRHIANSGKRWKARIWTFPAHWQAAVTITVD